MGGTSDIGYVDLTAAPGCGYLLAVYGPYIVLVDPATGGWIGYFDWSSGLQDNKLVGIAYYATQYDTDYQAFMDMFFVVDDMGNIYFDAIMPYNGGFVYFQGPDVGLVGNFGRETDTPYFNSLYFDGAYLYWSQFSQEADRWTCWSGTPRTASWCTSWVPSRTAYGRRRPVQPEHHARLRLVFCKRP